MGLFSGDKPYTAISTTIERMTAAAAGGSNDAAEVFRLIELIQVDPHKGTQEAGRALRKRIKYGNADQQVRAMNLVEMIVDNGGKQMTPMVSESALGDIIEQLSRSGDRRPQRHAQRILVAWQSREKPLCLYRPAPKDIFEAGQTKTTIGPQKSRGFSGWVADRDKYAHDHPGDLMRPTRSASRRPAQSRESSRSPSPVNLRGQSLTTTIATAHNVATRLSDALILNETTSAKDSATYYKQAKEIRHRVVQLITEDNAEVQEYLDQLLRANEELMISIKAYDDLAAGKSLAEIEPLRRAPERPQPVSSTVADSPEAPTVESSNSADPFSDDKADSDKPLHTPVW